MPTHFRYEESLAGAGYSCLPACFASAATSRQCCSYPCTQFGSAQPPAPTTANRKNMLRILLLMISDELCPAFRPIVFERVVVLFGHETVDANEVVIPMCASRQRDIGRQKCVVHGRESLLSVQDDVFRLCRAFVAVDWLTGQRREVLLLSGPEQQAANVIVEEYRAHQIANVPWFPLELALKVGDDKAPFPAITVTPFLVRRDEVRSLPRDGPYDSVASIEICENAADSGRRSASDGAFAQARCSRNRFSPGRSASSSTRNLHVPSRSITTVSLSSSPLTDTRRL